MFDSNLEDMCVCSCLCTCVISLPASLHFFLVKAIGDQWRLKVTNHPSSSHTHTALRATLPHNPSISSPSPHHLSLHSVTKRGPLGAQVSFVFGAKAPEEGLQGIRGRGGQLLHCFNWHYHFSGLTEMNHPLGP